ncbi:hypothetical protein [Nonomuraea sp. B19D2]|uniref:hypothetical protein n=1 Tax=Nonomuraea sp. B19D2 TaxID=3159561 RepID=UPI0032DB0132
MVLSRAGDFVPWLPWVVAGTTAVAVAGLFVAAFGVRRLAAVALVAGLFGSLAGPTAYALTPLSSAVQGTNPTAGPAGSGGFGGARQERPALPAGQSESGRIARPAGPDGGQVSTQLIEYLEANQGDAAWLVAVNSAQSASSIILSSGKAVIAMGGFTGSDPAMTVAKLTEYVSSGQLKYLLITSGNGPRGTDSSVTEWVKANGTLVDASAYGGTDSSGQALYKLG